MNQHTYEPSSSPASGNWFTMADYPAGHRLMRWVQDGTASEVFAVDAVLQTLLPEFTLNGGGPNLIHRWNSNEVSPQEVTLVKMLLPRTLPQRVRELTGDSAPDYNNGPAWISDPTNPGILLAWDGQQFTGEKELLSVVRQRIMDLECEVIETVSTIAPPADGAPGWHADPHCSTDFIHFGGQRWDRRKSVQEVLRNCFSALGEDVPECWKGEQMTGPSQLALIQQLTARINGVDGWYRSAYRFDDPVMRYWANGSWTEQYSTHPAAWLDDPWNEDYIRFWDGEKWLQQTRSKEAERIRDEKAQRRRVAVGNFALDVMKNYQAQNTPEMKRQRAQDVANERSRRLRDEAAIQQERFYRDRQIPWWKRR
jgi:hypothetical protein